MCFMDATSSQMNGVFDISFAIFQKQKNKRLRTYVFRYPEFSISKSRFCRPSEPREHSRDVRDGQRAGDGRDGEAEEGETHEQDFCRE